MTEKMEKFIDSYYEDSIDLPDHKLLTFKREVDYRRTERRAIHISLEDIETGTTIDLGTYFDARWKFTSPMNERVFWKYVKSNWDQFKILFDKMRGPVPTTYSLHFKKITERDSSTHEELSTIYNS